MTDSLSRSMLSDARLSRARGGDVMSACATGFGVRRRSGATPVADAGERAA